MDLTLKVSGWVFSSLGPRYGGNCIPLDGEIEDIDAVNDNYAENFIADIDVTSFGVPNGVEVEGSFGDDLAGDIFQLRRSNNV